jgi:shikimate 5-dehydrogenase
MNINSKTKLYCSFSKEAGDFGCKFHNAGFEKLGINAIYKSFSVENIEQCIKAMKHLPIYGAGISMPYKKQSISLVDAVDDIANLIGNINTIYLDQKLDIFIGCNTDYYAIKWALKWCNCDSLYIIGDGCYSSTVQYVASELSMATLIISRKRHNLHLISKIKNKTVFNCTPLDFDIDSSNIYLNCSISSKTGQELAFLQASEQFKLYTENEYPYSLKYFLENIY